VIADEAHAFRNTETRSFALGALVADWTDALIFLSATPLNLGNDDLYNLLQLLAPGISATGTCSRISSGPMRC